MPDSRKHRGPHPEDGEHFARDVWPVLQRAVGHLSWLLSRGYAVTSALKLVGDRFALTERQRKAILRSSCSDQALARRLASRVPPEQITGRILHVDGFNLITTVEAALAGGVLILGRDGCLRDMASMHGNYRKVAETLPALKAIGETLAPWQPAECIWFLDRPVSNSGRLSQMILETAAEKGWNWRTETLPDPDKFLRESREIVVSADSVVIDHAAAWLNLAAIVVGSQIDAVEIVPLEIEPRTQ